MNLKLTYKQKLKILPLVFLISLLLVYWIAIRDTLKIHWELNALKQQMITAGEAPKQLSALSSRLNELNRMSGKSNADQGNDPLLNFISTHSTASNKLVNYLPLHFFQNQGYMIETRIGVFEGDYRNLLYFLFELEKNYAVGKVVSVKFETETNVKTEKRRLLMTLYIQSVTNEKDTLVTSNANIKS